MGEQLLTGVDSNATIQSVQQVVVASKKCCLVPLKNVHGDNLPIIPAGSQVDASGCVLFRLVFSATVTDRASGSAVAGFALRLKSSRTEDKLTVAGVTDALGEVKVTLETRKPGELSIGPANGDLLMDPTGLSIGDAWYESLFLITGYNVCAEDDFSGELVEGAGLKEKHKKDFLYSAAGVPMQGTGKSSAGQYIRLSSMQCSWHKNAKGRPDYVADESKVSFSYASSVMGAFAAVIENQSIAVDRKVIPKRAKVEIDGLGARSADDRGSAIVGYHIDNFLGAGDGVVKAWLKGGINGTHRKVKYLVS